jgi:nucleoside-diphosphate-sugar epimerase
MIHEIILKEFNTKNVLVTGGSGLIGRQVVDILAAAGACIRSASLDRIIVNEKAENIVGDLTNLEFCKEIARDMDYIFHLAGIQGTVQTSSSKLASHFVPTLMMNTNMLEAARLSNVYTSSIGAYAESDVLRESDYKVESTPMSFAGWAKRMAELQIHAYKVQYGIDTFSIVRLSNIYGPGDNFNPETAMVIPSLMYRIFNGENPLCVWGDGTVIRDFLYSRDAAEGILLALHYGTAGDFVNIASGKGHSIRDIVTALQSFIDFDYSFDATKPSGAPVRVMDITKARELLGFIPSTDLTTGLKHTWEWFVGHSGEYKNKMNYFLPEHDS